MSGHTPGPWRVEKGTMLVWGKCIADDLTTWGMGYPVAEARVASFSVWATRPCSDEAEANARLIAAAPDLLAENEELRRAVSAMVDALHEAREYFDNRADADCDQDGFIPNEEMRLLSTVDEALKHERAIAAAEPKP